MENREERVRRLRGDKQREIEKGEIEGRKEI
jgi:hypothetical protein